MIYSCISGYYQSQIGQPLCTPCPSGQYQSQQGQTSCIQCPTGITITNPSSGANNVNQCIVDSDSNGLIDIKNITMFNNINNDLTGATYNDGTVNTNGGCPIISGNRKCRGYEL
ncbi:MAG: hypothetical protein QM532_04300 [Cyanobium sp. MAG06]|nr:hypothetical protein [Cyanobium sp. MAG06]